MSRHVLHSGRVVALRCGRRELVIVRQEHGTRVRGAGVHAVSPAQRGRSGATRLDGGEHTRTLRV